MERDYNTTRPDLLIKEYGRNVQNMVDYALSIEDREKRTKLAYIIVSVMHQVNPHHESMNVEVYKKLWDHLYAISDYKLDVDYPVDVQKLDNMQQLPTHLSYKDNRIMYRFYGQNTELLLKALAEQEPCEERDQYVIVMANQMKEMYIEWNKSIVEDDVVNEHIKRMTHGKLQIPENTHLTPSNQILKKLIAAIPSSRTDASKNKEKQNKMKPKPKGKFNPKAKRRY
jgi:hypothetical protein